MNKWVVIKKTLSLLIKVRMILYVLTCHRTVILHELTYISNLSLFLIKKNEVSIIIERYWYRSRFSGTMLSVLTTSFSIWVFKALVIPEIVVSDLLRQNRAFRNIARSTNSIPAYNLMGGFRGAMPRINCVTLNLLILTSNIFCKSVNKLLLRFLDQYWWVS